MQFQYSGPLDDEHVLTTNPLTVAPLEQKLYLLEEHPSDTPTTRVLPSAVF